MPQVRLTWNQNSPDYTSGYRLRVDELGLNAEIPQYTVSYDIEVPVGTNMHCYLTAFGPGGESEPAALEFMLTDNPPPPPTPTGFTWQRI